MNVRRVHHGHDGRVDNQAHAYVDGQLHVHEIVLENQEAFASVVQRLIVRRTQYLDFVVEPSASFVISFS